MSTSVPCYNFSAAIKGPVCKTCAKEPGMNGKRGERFKESYNQDFLNGKYLGQQLFCSVPGCWGVVKKANTHDCRCSDCITTVDAQPAAPSASSKAPSLGGSTTSGGGRRSRRSRSRSPISKPRDLVDQSKARNVMKVKEHLARGKALVATLNLSLIHI